MQNSLLWRYLFSVISLPANSVAGKHTHEMMHLPMLACDLESILLTTKGSGRDNRQEGHHPEKQRVRCGDI